MCVFRWQIVHDKALSIIAFEIAIAS